MAVKTITIDIESYELLARAKKPGQSFSQVIKERLGRPARGRDLLAALDRVRVSEETLDAVDRIVRARRSDRAKAPKL